MPQQLSPWIEGAYGWNFGEGGWNTGMDQNLLKFSFLFDRNVDGVVNSLPAVVNGQAYFLTTDNRLYFAVGNVWYSTPVPKWFEFKVRNTGDTYQFNGSSVSQVENPAGLDSRLDAVELTLSALGTAAFQNSEFFASQSALDVAQAQSENYTDSEVSNLGIVSVKQFGAAGDGITDDTLAIQNAINTVITTGGGTVYFPAGAYRINSSLIINYSANSARFAGKVHLKGASSTSTFIFNSGAFSSIEVVGSLSSFETYFELANIRLSGAARVAGSRGLRTTNSVAYLTMRDVIIEDFEYGWVAQDTEQLGIYDSFIRYNDYGVLGLAAAVTTSANSWSFYNSVISGNIKWGMDITNANALNWNGGSVQYNGFIGDGNSAWGIKINEAGDGYGTVGFTNMIFEGNGGLGDLVSVQDTNSCAVNLNNVSFVRTVNFASATVTGAANNGSGAIRLTLSSTTPLVGRSAVQITGVVGTTEANRAQPWPFTIINGTQIDLIDSTFSNAYVSGGIATIVGYGRNCVLATGTNAASTYTLTGCTFKSSVSYLPSALRPTIALDNASAKISDDGTNVFQHAIEKLTYIQTQQIGDDGSSWTVVPTTVTAAGGTFTATGTLRVKKIGKTVHFQLDAQTTSWVATPTAPISFTIPYPSVSRNTYPAVNATTLNSLLTVQQNGSSSVGVWAQTGAFPVTANGQRVVVSGTYETSA